jgi:hypothetical protein
LGGLSPLGAGLASGFGELTPLGVGLILGEGPILDFGALSPSGVCIHLMDLVQVATSFPLQYKRDDEHQSQQANHGNGNGTTNNNPI